MNKSEIERQNTAKAISQEEITPCDEGWEVVGYKHERRILRTQEIVEKVRKLLATAREDSLSEMKKDKANELSKLTLD